MTVKEVTKNDARVRYVCFYGQTLPHQTMQRESDYRWPSNPVSVNGMPISFSALARKTSRGRCALSRTDRRQADDDHAQVMAEEGRAWPLLDGTGMIYGCMSSVR